MNQQFWSESDLQSSVQAFADHRFDVAIESKAHHDRNGNEKV